MTGKIISLTIGITLAAILTSAQSSHTPVGTGARLLALPRPGVPISFEQIEEHSYKLADDTSTVESLITSKTYRDSAGRLRIESEARGGDNHAPVHYILLSDPVNGSQIVLLPAEKIGYRRPFPISSEITLFFADALTEDNSSYKWENKTEDLGERAIAGIPFQGTRSLWIAQGEPNKISTIEQWYSDKLKLIGAVEGSGSLQTFTIRIQNLRHEEPDSKLFTIPTDYKIIELQSP